MDNIFIQPDVKVDADTGERRQNMKLRRGRRYEITVNSDGSFDVQDLGPAVKSDEAQD